MPDAAKAALAARLRARIAAEGPISLEDFWQAAMTDPDGGYYTQGQPIGGDGDFTTAPEISQIFGELIGLWLVDAWDRAGQPAAFALVELGPGRGQLMADALRAAALAPEFGRACRLILGEASPTLQATQKNRLPGAAPIWRPNWRQAIEYAGKLPLFLVANEFFDALPIRQYEFKDRAWRERRVGMGAARDGFAFTLADVPQSDVPAPLAVLGAPPEGAILEHGAEQAEVAATIARQIAQHGGAALIVDYGFAGHRLGDSLQALRDGAPADALAAPGAADITAHVNFQSLIDAAKTNGAKAFGPVDQGAFLLALGAEARADALKQKATPAAAAEIDRSVRRLLHPLAMGRLFKALAILPPNASPPAGFQTS